MYRGVFVKFSKPKILKCRFRNHWITPKMWAQISSYHATQTTSQPTVGSEKWGKKGLSHLSARRTWQLQMPLGKVTEASNWVIHQAGTQIPLFQDTPTGHLNLPAWQIHPTINWEESVYNIFTIEPTAGHQTEDDIIEHSAWLHGTDRIHVKDGVSERVLWVTSGPEQFQIRYFCINLYQQGGGRILLLVATK